MRLFTQNVMCNAPLQLAQTPRVISCPLLYFYYFHCSLEYEHSNEKAKTAALLSERDRNERERIFVSATSRHFRCVCSRELQLIRAHTLISLELLYLGRNWFSRARWRISSQHLVWRQTSFRLLLPPPPVAKLPLVTFRNC